MFLIQDSHLSNILSVHLLRIKKESLKIGPLQSYKKQEKDVRLLTYKILVEQFNKKYTTLDQQKDLLKEYINNVNNTSKFVDYYKGEMKKLVSSLHEEYTKTKDKVTKIKLKETLNLLRKQKVGRKVTDNQVSS